ncbi:MAG: hypothetical protein COU69_03535 [Candidatus Pacebacteria bacterium CG10_big_fil_rev_8_21_14_0_10_56_10]|nr:MAG: hypothetical protein COU69_03535 [Candidatus Pacebacteria bacterium CG10_big_fil_rev_8_21_14_0_10_56_10]
MIALYFGQMVARWRHRRRWSVLDLARRAGLTRGQVTAIESGSLPLRLPEVNQVSTALQVSPLQLLSPEPDTPPVPSLVTVLKLGGSWDMVSSAQGLLGQGPLDEAGLLALEQSVGNDETQLALTLARKFAETAALTTNLSTHLSWVPDLAELAKGMFVPLFSGDSSHFRPSFYAAILEHVFRLLRDDPKRQLVIGTGTDTIDALLSFLDCFSFDLNAQPIIVTGANYSFREPHSDAPQNFRDAVLATHLPLPPGAFFIFGSTIFRGGDVTKLDPRERPQTVEGIDTFFAPFRSHLTLDVFGQSIPRQQAGPEAATQPTLQSDAQTAVRAAAVPVWGRRGPDLSKLHSPPDWTAGQLFETMKQIVTIDLISNNPLEEELRRLGDSRYQAMIIRSHALGNVSNPIRQAAMEAAKQGKLVVAISRCLVGEVSDRYYVSLVNLNHRELRSTQWRILNGDKLNSASAKALLTRAVLEGRDQQETQALIDAYVEHLEIAN